MNNKFIRNIILLCMFVFCPFLSIAKKAVLDIDLVLKKSVVYQKFLKDINKQINLNYIKFNKKISNLNKKEKEINDQVDLVTEEEIEYEKDKLNIKRNDIYSEIRNIETKLNQDNLYTYHVLITNIQDLVKKYVLNKYNLVLNNNIVIYSDSTVTNITDDIIYLINKETNIVNLSKLLLSDSNRQLFDENMLSNNKLNNINNNNIH